MGAKGRGGKEKGEEKEERGKGERWKEGRGGSCVMAFSFG